MTTYTTEVVRNIWDDSEGVALTIGPDGDSLGLIEIRPKDGKSEEYWGKVRLTMTPEMATQVAHAILAAVKDASSGDNCE